MEPTGALAVGGVAGSGAYRSSDVGKDGREWSLLKLRWWEELAGVLFGPFPAQHN